MRLILLLAGVVIWALASRDTIWNGADLLGVILTIGGALALAAKHNNKENESDQ